MLEIILPALDKFYKVRIIIYGLCEDSSAVEHPLLKWKVVGSNPTLRI